ncbi:MAG TPA: regulatory protein RecX, partial [Streptosporangiaceae bacterium]
MLDDAEHGLPAGDAGGSPAAEEAARLICLRLLARRPRTRAELARALRRRRVPDDVAESVLGRFTEVGLIDDAAFAKAWVESRHHGRGLARRALAAELKQRAVAAEEIRKAIDTLRPEEEIATARRLVSRRVPATRGQPLPVSARHLLGLLARKGYSARVAYRVVREALQEEYGGEAEAQLDLAGLEEYASDDDWPGSYQEDDDRERGRRERRPGEHPRPPLHAPHGPAQALLHFAPHQRRLVLREDPRRGRAQRLEAVEAAR